MVKVKGFGIDREESYLESETKAKAKAKTEWQRQKYKYQYKDKHKGKEQTQIQRRKEKCSKEKCLKEWETQNLPLSLLSAAGERNREGEDGVLFKRWKHRLKSWKIEVIWADMETCFDEKKTRFRYLTKRERGARPLPETRIIFFQLVLVCTSQKHVQSSVY